MGKLKDKIVRNFSMTNRRAAFEFHFLDKYIAGIKLVGTEIKSLRLGKLNMQDSFCFFLAGELWIKHLHISEYEFGNRHNHDPKADRKLLLTKRELKRLSEEMKDQGLTIIPTRLFINEKGLAKLEIALAKGKKLYDKRESIKEKDMKRELRES